jgi:hypothetical protein
MAFVQGIRTDSPHGYKYTEAYYPEIQEAKKELLFDKVARNYWEIYRHTKDYRKACDFLLSILTEKQRDSEEFSYILNKRKPADL